MDGSCQVPFASGTGGFAVTPAVVTGQSPSDCILQTTDTGGGVLNDKRLGLMCDGSTVKLLRFFDAQCQRPIVPVSFGYTESQGCLHAGGTSHFHYQLKLSPSMECLNGVVVDRQTTTTTTSTTLPPGSWKWGTYSDANCQTPFPPNTNLFTVVPPILTGHSPSDCLLQKVDTGGGRWSETRVSPKCDGSTVKLLRFPASDTQCQSPITPAQFGYSESMGCYQDGASVLHYQFTPGSLVCQNGVVVNPYTTTTTTTTTTTFVKGANWTLQFYDDLQCGQLAEKKHASPNPLVGGTGDCIGVKIFLVKTYYRETGCQPDGSGTPRFMTYSDSACTVPLSAVSTIPQNQCTNANGGLIASCTTTTTTTASTTTTATTTTTAASVTSTAAAAKSPTTKATVSTTAGAPTASPPSPASSTTSAGAPTPVTNKAPAGAVTVASTAAPVTKAASGTTAAAAVATAVTTASSGGSSNQNVLAWMALIPASLVPYKAMSNLPQGVMVVQASTSTTTATPPPQAPLSAAALGVGGAAGAAGAVGAGAGGAASATTATTTTTSEMPWGWPWWAWFLLCCGLLTLCLLLCGAGGGGAAATTGGSSTPSKKQEHTYTVVDEDIEENTAAGTE
eukprot:CAMPEP_0178423822 /NCGR_PEP_ID=MMETSP0689_2-20121128/27885_1 /TAXON_ID=160604 /ORGANISM="Amphidinium massartii, Strain CS-259" /LENGTH=619 /DNA_ID=CAMNT_0020045425 /DNA_START=125 /DNA_END=1984 /DNA_ORIENTATION=+